MKKPIAFILASTHHGPLILSHLDHMKFEDNNYGVGYELLRDSEYNMDETQLLKDAANFRRKNYEDGVVIIDCGANIGVFTIELARHLTGWGKVFAIEAQTRLFYALAGNIALNNLFNATAINVAVTDKVGGMSIPTLDYSIPSSFGSFELKPMDTRELIGQEVNYEDHLTKILTVSLDSLNFDRVDIIKLDVEGMEMDVLKGSEMIINLFHPIIFVEYHKVGEASIRKYLEPFGYKIFEHDKNLFCIHESDPCLGHVVVQEPKNTNAGIV